MGLPIGKGYRGTLRQVDTIEVAGLGIADADNKLRQRLAACQCVACTVHESHGHSIPQQVVGAIVVCLHGSDDGIDTRHLYPCEGDTVGQSGYQSLTATFFREGYCPVAPALGHRV